MARINSHTFNYGQASNGDTIRPPEGYKLLDERDFIPAKHQVWCEKLGGWKTGGVPAVNRAKVNGDNRCYAVPRK